MQNNDNLKHVLREAGFSEYEAEVYVTLLPFQQASVSKIASASSVPQPRVYDVIRSLEADGYVNTYKEDVLFGRVDDVSQLVTELEDQGNRLINAAERIESIWERPQMEMHNLLTFDEYDRLIDESLARISSATNNIHISANPTEIKILEEELRDAIDRNVSIHISIHDGSPDSEPQESVEDIFPEIATQVRSCDAKGPFISLIDGSLAVLGVPGTWGNEYGLVIRDHVLTSMLYWYFQIQMWEFWNVIYSCERPNVYMSIRELIRDVEAFDAAEAEIRATVKGYETSTGEFVEQSGVIKDTLFVNQSAETPLNYLFIQAAIVLQTDETEYTVGGYGAILEDLRAMEISINSVE